MMMKLDTIVVGDCLDVMKEMPDGCVDLVVVDPPYPNLKGGYVRAIKYAGVAERKNESVSVGMLWDTSLTWIPEAWRVARYGLMCFCSHHSVAAVYNALSPMAKTMGLITWHVRNAAPTGKNVPRYDTQFVWLFSKRPGLKWDVFKTMVFSIPVPPAGCFASERVLIPGTKKAAHPTQKPVALLVELLKVGGDVVFDPFMGTGTTAVAALKLDRHFYGCDISPEYVELANKRIEKARLETAQLSFSV